MYGLLGIFEIHHRYYGHETRKDGKFFLVSLEAVILPKKDEPSAPGRKNDLEEVIVRFLRDKGIPPLNSGTMETCWRRNGRDEN